MTDTDLGWLLVAIKTDPSARYGLRDLLEERGEWTWPRVSGLVAANPGPDGLRLLAADWCGEQTSRWWVARAEFVRAQVELAHMPAGVYELDGPRPGLPEWARRRALLLERCRSLLAGHGAVWREACPLLSKREWGDPGGEPPVFGVEHRRGFPETFTCRWSDWEADGDRLLSRHPVREVRLTTPPALEHARAMAGLWNVEVAGRLVVLSQLQFASRRDVRPGTGPTSWEFSEAALRLRWPGVRFRRVWVGTDGPGSLFAVEGVPPVGEGDMLSVGPGGRVVAVRPGQFRSGNVNVIGRAAAVFPHPDDRERVLVDVRLNPPAG